MVYCNAADCWVGSRQECDVKEMEVFGRELQGNNHNHLLILTSNSMLSLDGVLAVLR